MSQFLVDMEQLRQMARMIRDHAVNSDDIVTALDGELANLDAEFAGQTARAFHAHMEEWRTSARSVTLALTSLGDFLDEEAVKAEEMDSELAAG